MEGPVEFSKLISLVKGLPDQVASVSAFNMSSKHFELLALLLDDTDRLVKDGRLSLYGHKGELNGIGLSCVALQEVITSVDGLLKGKPPTVVQSVKKFLTHKDPVKRKSRSLIAELHEVQLNFTMAVMQSCTSCSQYDAIKGSVDQLQRWLKEDYPDDTVLSEASTFPSTRCLEVKPTRLFQKDLSEENITQVDGDDVQPSTDPESNVNTMLHWLDGAECKANQMTETPIVVQKKSLINNLERLKLLMADINQHKPVLDSLNSNVADDEDQHHPDEDEEQTPTTKDDHQQDDDTKKTEDLRESIDSINRRYVDVTKTVHEFEDRLETLSAKLGDFENEVGALEDWALPLYETLKTSEISLFSLSDFENKLKEYQSQFDEHKATLTRINQLGEELLKDNSSNDTTHITSVLENINATWKTLEDTLAKRKQQYEDLLKTKGRYDVTHGSVVDWLTVIERRVEELHLDSIDSLSDAEATRELLLQVKAILSDVTDYQSKISDNDTNADSLLDTLNKKTTATTTSESTPKLRRSAGARLEIPTSNGESSKNHKRASTGFKIEISMQHDFSNDKQRYDDLLRRLQLAFAQLELSSDWLKHMDDLKVNQEWVTSFEDRVEDMRPSSFISEYCVLAENIRDFKTVRSDIRNRRAHVTESVHEADYFLRLNHDKLSEERRDELRKRLSDVRERFGTLDNDSEQVLQLAFDKLGSFTGDSESWFSNSSRASSRTPGSGKRRSRRSPDKANDGRPPWSNIF